MDGMPIVQCLLAKLWAGFRFGSSEQATLREASMWMAKALLAHVMATLYLHITYIVGP
jgi:hypothetical protein